MKATLRPLDTGETDPELLALAGSAGAFAYGAAWLAAGLPLPPCAFHAVTGCPCPTCGATHCVLALLHGRIREAIGWNPLVFCCLAGVAVLNLYAAAVLAGRFPRLRLSISPLEGRILGMAFVFVATTNWAYVIGRGLHR